MFNKIINKYLLKKKPKLSKKILTQLKMNKNTNEFLNWLIYDHGKVHFNLEEDEMTYLTKNYLIDWQENEFDNSFLNWSTKTPYLKLNYFIEAIKGVHGFMIAQNAFDYLCDNYLPLTIYFETQN